MLLIAFRKYMASHGLPTLCDGQEKPTQWKSESVTAQPTYGLSRVGSRDAYTSKKYPPPISQQQSSPLLSQGQKTGAML